MVKILDRKYRPELYKPQRVLSSLSRFGFLLLGFGAIVIFLNVVLLPVPYEAQTTGTIVHIGSSTKNGQNITVRYTVDEKFYHKLTSLAYHYPKPQIGQTLVITYNPENPKWAELLIDEQERQTWLSHLNVIFLLGFLCFGLYTLRMLYLRLRYPSTKKSLFFEYRYP